jgi:lysyl-tRNA synthetase class 2
MELYVAYRDYAWMMDLVEEMVEDTALSLHGTTQVQVGDHLMIQTPWKRFTCSRRSRISRDRYIGYGRGSARETARKLMYRLTQPWGKVNLLTRYSGNVVSTS